MKKVILFGSNKKIIVQQNIQKQIFTKQDIHTPFVNNLKQKVIQQNLIQQIEDDQNLINYNNQIKQQYQIELNDDQVQTIEKNYKKTKKRK